MAPILCNVSSAWSNSELGMFRRASKKEIASTGIAPAPAPRVPSTSSWRRWFYRGRRQTESETQTQTQIESERQTEIETQTQTQTQTQRETQLRGEIVREKETETETQTVKQTERQTEIHKAAEVVPVVAAVPPAAPSSSAILVTPHEAKVCASRIRREFHDLRSESNAACDSLPNLRVAMNTQDHLQWYVLIHSLSEPCFEGGEYLVHISLSPRYPFAPPDFYFLTPNGRFEINRKLCFSNTSFHAELWSPIWKIKTIILGFFSFFLEKNSSGVGHLQGVTDERKKGFATQSKEYNERHHSDILQMIRQQYS